MFRIVPISLAAASCATALATPVVQEEITALTTPGSFNATYTVSGFEFLANEELDILFPASLYGLLSNGSAGPGFLVQLFQPNQPTGFEGDYSALALLNHPSLTQPFTVDFTFTGKGSPGAQPFQINQFSSSGVFESTLASGNTAPIDKVTPEPGVFLLTFAGLVLYVILSAPLRRRLLR